YNITATADLDWAQIVSASSWGQRVSTAYQDQGGVSTFSFDSFAQELRLVRAPQSSSRWDYVLGLYFSRDKQGTELVGAGFGGASVTQIIEERFKEQAVFGELGFRFTRRLSARLGVRAQRVDYDTSQSNAPGGPPPASGNNTPTTGRAVVS